jgi:hypothetical protein
LGIAVEARADAPKEHVTEIDPIDIPPEHDPLAHAWDRPEQRGGFYLRASTNIGYMVSHMGPAAFESSRSNNERLFGFGTNFGLDIGGFLAPWVALHLDTTAGVLWNGSVDADLYLPGQGGRIAAFGAAPAATFVLPHDFTIKTAFGVGIARIKRNGDSDFTHPGFYMDLAFGNDVYTSDHLAVGLQFQIVYMNLDADKKQDESRIQQYMWGISVAYDSI